MGALDGLKVLDLTSMVSGPVAAMMLADQGARVIKVEPLIGEQMRHIGGKHNEVSPTFYSCNRGKESISLDLKSEEGKKILLELAADADVFIQNFRPGAIERMGFGEDVLRKTNKQLIYVSRAVRTHKSGCTIPSFRLCQVLPTSKWIGLRGGRRCSASFSRTRSHR